MLEAIIAGLFGLIVGSFLNVLILRWQTGMTFGGRSQCFSCAKQLHWYELVPVVSYLFLKGRCSACKSGISWQYPAVELCAGLLGFAIVFFYGITPLAGLLTVVAWIFLALSVYDIMHMILPDSWTLAIGLLAIGGGLLGWLPIVSSATPLFDWLAGVIFAAPFLLLWLFSKGRLMGFGDIKLILVIGLLHGWYLGLSTLLIAFWGGAIISLLWLAYGRFFKKGSVTMSSPLPFGPFLAAGAVFSIIFPVSVLDFLFAL